MPATLTFRIFKKYRKYKDSVTEYKEYKGNNHYIIGPDTFKEYADYIHGWIGTH